MVIRFSAGGHFAVVIGTALAALCGIAGSGWSQTVINTIQDLQNINNNLAGSYVLGADIDATATANWNGGEGFIPIGNSNAPFTGSFDGQGHTINGLTSSYSPIFYSGLFGLVGQSGIVKNVGVTNASIATGFISGEGGGVLVGFNVGTVTNSYATGAINGGNLASNVGGLVGTNQVGAVVTQSFANVAVTGNGIYSYGGLVGDNAGTISQSYATGPVSATAQENGGLVGLNLGAILESYATGAVSNGGVVGGLVGVSTGGTISQTYAAGPLAGLAGAVGGLIAYQQTTTSTSSYWDTQATGQTTSAAGTGMTTAQLQIGTLPAGFDPTVWTAMTGQYPLLQWQTSLSPPVSLGPAAPYNRSGFASEPVNTATGNYYSQTTDLAFPGRGLPFAFTRTYNAQDPYSGPFGPGWTHSYNLLLTTQAGGTVAIKWGDGHQEFYSPGSGGVFVSETPGVFNILAKFSDGSYTLTTKGPSINYRIDF